MSCACADYRGPTARDQLVGRRFPAAGAVLFQRVIGSEEPLIIDNLHGDSPLATEYREWAALHAGEAFVLAQSVLAVPLKVQGQVIGQLRLDHDQPGFYRPRHAELAQAFANQAATAIANARLFEAERRSREDLVLALEAGQMGIWEWESATGQGHLVAAARSHPRIGAWRVSANIRGDVSGHPSGRRGAREADRQPVARRQAAPYRVPRHPPGWPGPLARVARPGDPRR